MRYYIDFETKSSVPIEHGIKNYLASPDADIVCLGSKIGTDKTTLWTRKANIPITKFEPEDRVYAHNAFFDWRVWNTFRNRYGYPYLPLNQVIDVMAICGRFTFPQALAKVGQAIDLKDKKFSSGKALIQKICCPPFKYTKEELHEFYRYCIRDVNSMYELIYTLPADALSNDEQKVWELTMKINDTGLPIDVPSVHKILEVTQAYQMEHAQRLPDMTGHLITKITQTQRIVKWVNSQGFKMSNCQAGTVEKMLTQKDLSDGVREILEMRQELGSSSVAKYVRLKEQEHHGRVYDNLRYYGAGTGRWAGMGFQMHNLPRAKVEDPEAEIAKYFDFSIVEENPVKTAKALIRPMIKAPRNLRLIVADYASIEYVLLIWVADDQVSLKLVRSGRDQYVDMASFLFNVPYDEVNDDQRFLGKIIILGCGYQLGAKGFLRVSQDWGLTLTMAQCQHAVGSYRNRYSLVKNLWNDLRVAAMKAIVNPRFKFTKNKCTFRLVTDKVGTPWLQMTLPSGRALYYNKPWIGDGDFGPEIKHWGINPYSKQWSKLKLSPGRLTENVIQALARDVLVAGKMNLDKAGYELIGSIHDEAVSEIPKEQDTEETLKDYCDKMCILPTWADGIPMRATGYIGKRYKKM